MSESGAAPASGEKRWDVLAREAAQRRDLGSEVVELLQLLTFELEGAPYALPVECVREIVRIRPITPVPRMPEEVRGVISLRGEIVQVVDLRRRLGLEPVELGRRSRVIVVHGGDGRVAGLLVDAVTEVLSVADDALRPASGEVGAVDQLCVRVNADCGALGLDQAEMQRIPLLSLLSLADVLSLNGAPQVDFVLDVQRVVEIANEDRARGSLIALRL